MFRKSVLQRVVRDLCTMPVVLEFRVVLPVQKVVRSKRVEVQGHFKRIRAYEGVDEGVLKSYINH